MKWLVTVSDTLIAFVTYLLSHLLTYWSVLDTQSSIHNHCHCCATNGTFLQFNCYV